MSKGKNPDRLRLISPAKVNLFFEILGRRDDSFHDVETVMATVSLYDSLEFRLRDDNLIALQVLNGAPDVPTGPDNLIVRALQICRQISARPGELAGMDIVLQKRIPSAAGLGGASGNAAAAVVAANRLWKLRLDQQQIQAVTAELGSDVPFFVEGGMAFCTGRGEKIQALPSASGIPIVIATPPEGLATAKVYSCVRPPEIPIASPWRAGSPIELSSFSGMFNRLEQFAEPLTPWIGRLRREFGFLNCLGHQLSGSGSSYFGVFQSFRRAHIAARKLAARLPQVNVFTVRTIKNSIVSGSGFFAPHGAAA